MDNNSHTHLVPVISLLNDLKQKGHLNQKDIGEYIGLNRSNISRYFNGHNVDMSISRYERLLCLYIEALGVNPNKGVISTNISTIPDQDLAKELEERGWKVSLSPK